MPTGAPPSVCRPSTCVITARLVELSVPACKGCVDALAYLSFDESAAAGGSLKLIGKAQVLGTPLLEPSHRFNADF